MSIDELKKKILPVLKRYGIRKAAVFGSFARGEDTENSDIDLLVEFNDSENKSLLDLAGIQLDLQDLLGRDVDILTYRSIHPLLKDYILRDEKVFYEERP
ncbi:nucleotidyltransferase family protein [candidate division WOR-3 bacterium]|nr:nucleotidyltransferase family protein [candidate division WOR-3 bacterium]